MNALTLVFTAMCIFAIAYRFYGLYIAKNYLQLHEERPTPAIALADGHDYHKTNKYVLFGHHFAAIAAAGPLLGPVLAAQFGFLPGALWIIVGCVLAGAVHDMVVLFASVRHKGKSLSLIAQHEIGARAGLVASFAILFILILTLAGLSIAVVNALFESAWGTFTVACTIPIALLMGLWLYKIRPGDVFGASLLGVALLFAALLAGPYVAAHPTLAALFTYKKHSIAIMIVMYGFIASVLPVWMLLCPRDYLSTYLKLGTIAMLVIGIFWVHPQLQMPSITAFVHGGGPVIPGKVFPFLFITIACGAISGFHAIIGTGTTPKMIDSERSIPFIGYGAMLTEGLVAIMALVAACVLVPADYFAINAAPKAFAALHMMPVHLPELSKEIGETLQGRPGGAVSLATGMAYIFSSIPFMKTLASYWYHFAIMFEAVFILTAVDTGTRVGRYMLQELVGKVIPQFDQKKWIPGILICSAAFTGSWGYLVYTGDIFTIWPLFGMSNQLLATCALIVSTTMLIRMGRVRLSWITAVPSFFMIPVVMSAGYLNVVNNYLPARDWLKVILSIVLMVLMSFVFVEAFYKWYKLTRIHTTVRDRWGEMVLAEAEE